MPTARWDRPQQLFGLIEQEETVALVPLLGTTLYQHLLEEYDRLREAYEDITATTVRPTGKAKKDARLAHADVTERLEQIQQGKYRETYTTPEPGEKEVPAKDLKTIRLIRICQQIEFYRMLSHKAGLLNVSLNEGGGMNDVGADGYDPSDTKKIEHAVMDALKSADRAVDSLLLFLEADAKGERMFTEKWQEADAFYLHKDLLFQTARVLNEYLDIKGERMVYVQLVRDIRFCQNTYLKPRVGAKLLKAVVEYANEGLAHADDSSASGDADTHDGAITNHAEPAEEEPKPMETEAAEELLEMLRTALAFYVEGRRTTYTRATLTGSSSTRSTSRSTEKDEKLARRDSMTNAQQAMAMACEYIEENLDALGDAAVGTPIYIARRAREAQEEQDRANARAAECRRRKAQCEQNNRKLFTGFPATHRTPEHK